MASDLNEEERKIVEKMACYRKDWDESVISSPPEEHDPVRKSLLNAFESQEVRNLGYLGAIPLDVVYEIVPLLDIQSCFRLRQASHAFRALVSSVWEYREMARHAIEFFRAALRTKSASRFTLKMVLKLLVQENCSNCPKFAPFVSLGNARRYCMRCLKTHTLLPDLPDGDEVRTAEMFSLYGVAKGLGLTANNIQKTVPVTVSVPGYYTARQNSQKRRARLICIQDAIRIARRRFPGQPFNLNWMGEYHVEYRGLMCAVALPYINMETGKVDYGVCCLACQGSPRHTEVPSAESYDAYTHKGFLDHCRDCGMAKQLRQELEGEPLIGRDLLVGGQIATEHGLELAANSWAEKFKCQVGYWPAISQ